MDKGPGLDRRGAEQGKARVAKAQEGGWDGAGLGRRWRGQGRHRAGAGTISNGWSRGCV